MPAVPVRKHRRTAGPPACTGSSLLIALIALLMLTLSAAALVRSVHTGSVIAGNLSFKQDAIEAAAVGAEQAMDWLEAQTNLEQDLAQSGYYASVAQHLDPSNTASSATSALTSAFDSARGNAVRINGNTVQWVLVRACARPGPVINSACMLPTETHSARASERDELTASGRIAAEDLQPYYRVLVRASGPRGTVGYTETLVHF